MNDPTSLIDCVGGPQHGERIMPGPAVVSFHAVRYTLRRHTSQDGSILSAYVADNVTDEQMKAFGLPKEMRTNFDVSITAAIDQLVTVFDQLAYPEGLSTTDERAIRDGLENFARAILASR